MPSDIARTAVESSNVKSIGYRADTHTLAVEFADGAVYHYHGVPEHVHAQLVGAPSKGSYLHKFIKNAYPVERVPA